MKYQHIISAVCNQPWAILPEKMRAISAMLAFQASGGKLTEEQIREVVAGNPDLQAARQPSGPRAPGGVAVISIRGVIAHRMNQVNDISGPGGTSIEGLTKSFRAALNDPNVKAIVFDVESPGGSVDGVPELADEIYQARGQKKTVAVANTFAASAAYWLASSASELVVTPSGMVGSIGVYCMHDDISQALEKEGVKITLVHAGKYKVDGNSFEPLSDSARADMQSQVDSVYGMFVKAVARNRGGGTKQSDVMNGFGEGRMVMGNLSVKQKMADRVATFDEVLASFGVGQKAETSLAASNENRDRVDISAQAEGISAAESSANLESIRREHLDGELDTVLYGGSKE